MLAQVQEFCPGPGPGQDLSRTWPGLDLDLTWDLEWDLEWDLNLSLTIPRSYFYLPAWPQPVAQEPSIGVCVWSEQGKQRTIKTIKLNLILWLSALTHGPAEVGVLGVLCRGGRVRDYSNKTFLKSNIEHKKCWGAGRGKTWALQWITYLFTLLESVASQSKDGSMFLR